MIYENIFYFIAIILAYIFIFLIIPSYVMYPVVKEKSLGHRLFTYLIASHFYVVNVVYILGYAHLFYWITVFILVVILPVSIRSYMHRNIIMSFFKQLKEVYSENYNLRLMLRRYLSKIKESFIFKYGNLFKKNPLEIFLFLLLFFAIIIFYGYYKFHYNSYGISDEEVHLYWIQSLIDGEFFVSGMYPFGMHSVIATICVITKINAVFVSQMFSIIILSQVIIFIYLLLRKVFKFKFGILFGIFFWLLVKFGGVFTYFRYQYTLPMEYGLLFVFGAIYFLISYIQDKKKINLWMFGFAVSLTFSTHFYLTAFAGIICICIGFANIWGILKKKIIHLLLGMAILGIVMSSIPFGVGYLIGYQFEQSVDWALSVMKTSEITSVDGVEITQTKNTLSLKNPKDIYEGIKTALTDANLGGLKKNELNFILITELVLFIYAVIGLIFSKRKLSYSFFLGISLSWVILVLLSVASKFGITQFIDANRVMVWVLLLNTILIAGIFEILFTTIAFIVRREDLSRVIMIYALGCLLYFMLYEDCFKNDRKTVTIQTEQQASFCENIIQNYEKDTWTLVSAVNDRSMIINSGFFYEWIDLLEKLENLDNKIYIPTKYVFFNIEKRPISYNAWIDVFEKKNIVGKTKVSSEFASQTINFDVEDKLRSQLYQDQREEIMSKAYYWAKEYASLFPHEMQVYFEDDEIIIYRLEQDTYALNNLSINYVYN